MSRISNFRNSQIKADNLDYLDLSNTNETVDKKILYKDLVSTFKTSLDGLNIIPSSNIKFNNTTQTLELFNTADLVPARKDGLILAFKLPKGLPLLPANCRVATSPTYTTGTQVYNGYYYDNYGYGGLDEGSYTTIGLNYLVWSASLNMWKLYKQSIKSSKLLQFNLNASEITTFNNCGYVLWDTDAPFNTTLYPVLSKAFNGGVIPKQSNATLAGYGNETPINVTSEGQVGVQKSVITLGNYTLKWTNGTNSTSIINPCYSTVNGGQYKPTNNFEVTNDVPVNKYNANHYPNGYTNVPNNNKLTFTGNADLGTANTGNETLTKRFGITMAIGL